jgi:L-lactate permease
MLLAEFQQHLDPLANKVLGSSIWSTLLAALPVLVLFWLLVPRRWLAPKAGATAALVAWLIAVFIYGMTPLMATMSFVHGAGFGLLPVGWTIFNAMLLYNITVQTGQFDIIRRSVASLSGDARVQAILIGFAFGAFLEGAAGAGSPVAICGAMMIGLGFPPFRAAVICLIANTSPVAYGGLGTPLITLSGVTGLDAPVLSVMAGHQLPIMSLFIPLYMVRCMCSWKQTWEVWPVLLVGGGSFAGFQYLFATMHSYGLPELWPMTDIGGGIFSLVVTALFLRYWKPKKEWHFDQPAAPEQPAPAPVKLDASNPHAAEAMALLGEPAPAAKKDLTPLTAGRVTLAWLPFILMSVFLLASGVLRQREEDRAMNKEHGPLKFGPIQTTYKIPIYNLDGQVTRDRTLHDPEMGLRFTITDRSLAAWRDGEVPAAVLAKLEPLKDQEFEREKYLAELNDRLTRDELKSYQSPLLIHADMGPQPEDAKFKFIWLTAPGTAVFLAALLSMAILRMNGQQMGRVVWRTCIQMKVPIPTIAFMLGLSYITRYAGMDATLGVAFAHTGHLYPYFAAMLGWLGVFLTGTDAGSNALFGSLQKITASALHGTKHFAHLSLHQAQVLICTANSTGGVMGKMIDAQSIVVATAATNQIGREADIFKAVLWHSFLLASIVGALTMLMAYVPPFTWLVP